jgi:MtrB/PioB family decaheme-associated outer membrane protein
MRRHSTLLGLGSVIALLAARLASADSSATVSGTLEAGVRGIAGDEASAKFDEYRDVTTGLFGASNLLLQDGEGKHYLLLQGFDLGEKDADYRVEGGRWGFWGISGSLSELPVDYSGRALTPYVGIDSGNLTVPFAPPVDAATFESSVRGAAHAADLQYDVKDSDIRAFWKPTSDLSLDGGYRILDRDGRRPDTLSFGFSNFVHMPEPVDETTQEATADLRLVREGWSADLNYTGSFFHNGFRSFQAENPAPFAGGSTVGAIAAAPDNSAHQLSLTGAAAIPASFPMRIAGTLAYGLRFQDEPFVPLTVNPALTPAPLPANDLNGRVQTFLGNLMLTAHPAPNVDVSARYRIYDYDNHSDEILFTQTSTFDAALATQTVRSFAPSYVTQNGNLDASYRFTSALKGTLGFAWNHWDRGPEREVRHSDDFTPKLMLDYRAGTWGRFETSYAYGWRSGSPYNELAPFLAVSPTTPPTPLTPPIRKFDEADNHTQTLHFLSQLYVREDTDVTLSGDFNFTKWIEGDFGLTNENQFDLGIDLTHRLASQLEITFSYNYDWWNLHLQSASSSGTLVWQSQGLDRAHTGGVTLTYSAIPDRLVLDGGYFIQFAQGQTRAQGAPADAVDYPNIHNELWAIFSTVSYRLNEHWTVVGRYRYEHYDQRNWQYDGLGVTRLTSNVEGVPLLGTNNDVYMRDGLPGYNANFFSVSAVLKF